MRTITYQQTRPEFFKWLDDEMKRQGFRSERELCLAAEVSNSVISKARSGAQPIKWEACLKLARALKADDDFVLRLAGLLKPKPDMTREREEWNHLLNGLSKTDQREMIATARALREQKLNYRTGTEDDKRRE